MIKVEELDLIVEEFEKKPDNFDTILQKVETDNIALFDILLGSHAEILNDDEMDFLVFLFIIIYQACSKHYPLPFFEEEEIEAMDESSWEIINEYNDFEKCYDQFQPMIAEEEILDFIYLSLEDDEEQEYDITDSGRLVMLSVLVSETRLLTKSQG